MNGFTLQRAPQRKTRGKQAVKATRGCPRAHLKHPSVLSSRHERNGRLTFHIKERVGGYTMAHTQHKTPNAKHTKIGYKKKEKKRKKRKKETKNNNNKYKTKKQTNGNSASLHRNTTNLSKSRNRYLSVSEMKKLSMRSSSFPDLTSAKAAYPHSIRLLVCSARNRSLPARRYFVLPVALYSASVLSASSGRSGLSLP